MSYDYDRSVVASSDNFAAYSDRLEALQMDFTGGVGSRVFEYINTLHGRLSKREPFSEISGFLSWDYGSPKDLDAASWGIRVWQKDRSTYPGDLDPNIYISLEFKADGKVEVVAEAGTKTLIDKTVSSTASSASSIGMAIGEAWEKALTGSVDYGD